MPYILKMPKIEIVKCSVCGCEYELQEGDELIPVFEEPVIRDTQGNIHRHAICVVLPCPVCKSTNNVQFIGENE